MNFATVTEIIHATWDKCRPKYRNQRLWRLWLRAILTLALFGIVGYFILRKIYEVPVNYTEIDIVHDGRLVKSSIIDIVLCRDFDRNRNVAIQKTDSGIVRVTKDSMQTDGALIVSGIMYLDSIGKGGESNITNTQDVDSLHKKMLDTTPELKEKASHLVYITMRGTRRQGLFKKTDSIQFSSIHKDTCLVFSDQKYIYEKNKFLNLSQMSSRPNKYWEIPIHYYFVNKRVQYNKHEFCEDCSIFCSMEDNICPIETALTGGDFNKPNVFTTLEDISKTVELINIPRRCADLLRSFTIDYRGAANFGYLDPEPDEMTISSIRYTDKDKLRKIAFNGLKYHVEFPDMENLQDIRILVLTAIVTLLFTLFVSLISVW